MKYCVYCGNELADLAVVCPKCGVSQSTNPQQNTYQNPQPNYNQQQYQHPYQQYSQPYYQQPYYPPVEEKANIGFCILAYFIPIFGVIYWALKKQEAPKTAKACLIVSIVSFAINMIITAAAFVAGFASTFYYF